MNYGLSFLQRQLGVAHVCSLARPAARDRAAAALLHGQPVTKVAILTTQLLTACHGSILHVLKVG